MHKLTASSDALTIFFICNIKSTGVGLLQHYVQNGKTKEDIIKAASGFCISFQIETPRVCLGIINLMAVSGNQLTESCIILCI